MKRGLTNLERALARSVFGDALDLDAVRINKRKWWPFQPRRVAMAPDGEIWFHPKGGLYRDCFGGAPLLDRAFLVHELVHVWQRQQGIYLPLARHPFCRYEYVLKPGKPFGRYGIEQQAEIVRHAFLLRNGAKLAKPDPLPVYDALLPFSK